MSEKPAWWRQEIRRLEGSLRGHLHRSLPALRQDHDDLVNDTLEGLAKHIERSPTVPDSWFGSVAPPEEHRLGYYRLAHTILNRRTTDFLRKRIPVLTAPKLIAELLTENESESIDRRMHMIRLFQQFQRLAVHFNAAVAIYGNHDAWPGRPPRLRDSAAVTSKQCGELKSHGYTIAQAAAPLHLKIPNGPEVQLFTIDTVDHKPRRNIRALGEVEVQQLMDLGQLVDQNNQALPANRRSLRILACHHPIHYPRRPRYSMRISNDKKVALALDGPTKAAARPRVHIVLGGHTHSLFPELGRLPSSTPLCVHPDLGDHQCQLNVGSLMQIDRYDKRGPWPNQAQFLRFYFTPDPFLIIVARQIAARCPGVKADYGFIEVDPSKRPGAFEERISLAI